MHSNGTIVSASDDDYSSHDDDGHDDHSGHDDHHDDGHNDHDDEDIDSGHDGTETWEEWETTPTV